MEHTSGRDFTADNTRRATNLRTRLQSKKQQEKDAEIAVQTQGLSAAKWWDTYVRDKNTIMKFYELYHPEYPEILVKSIAQRIDGIVQKTRTGEKLTEEDKQIVVNSKKPSDIWDPMEDILEQEFQGKLNNSIKHLENLL